MGPERVDAGIGGGGDCLSLNRGVGKEQVSKSEDYGCFELSNDCISGGRAFGGRNFGSSNYIIKDTNKRLAIVTENKLGQMLLVRAAAQPPTTPTASQL